MIIYQAHNRISNAFYVGKTVKPLQHRINQHMVDAGLARNNSIFHKAIRKYGKDAFDWYVLVTAGSLEDLNNAERVWIERIRSAGHRLYNLRPGGDGGSVAGKANHNYGRTMPDSVRMKVSEGLKRYYSDKPGPMTGQPGPMTGKKHTAETRKKISDGLKGPRPSIAGALNPSARAVVCVTTGKMFDTATIAAREYEIDMSSIIKCCRGKKKTVGGYEFEYAKPSSGVFGWVVV